MHVYDSPRPYCIHTLLMLTTEPDSKGNLVDKWNSTTKLNHNYISICIINPCIIGIPSTILVHHTYHTHTHTHTHTRARAHTHTHSHQISLSTLASSKVNKANTQDYMSRTFPFCGHLAIMQAKQLLWSQQGKWPQLQTPYIIS